MNSIFKATSTKHIFINGYEYVVHDYVLKKISLFSLLFDESFDKQEIKIELTNYDPIIIDEIFKMFYNPQSIELVQESSIDDNINQLALMMYFVMNTDIIVKYAQRITGRDRIIMELLGIQYHECMNLVVDEIDILTTATNVCEYVTLIKKTEFPESFQIKIISILITNTIDVYVFPNRYHMDVSLSDDKYTPMSDTPIMIYDAYQIECHTAKIYYREEKFFDKLVVNDEEIEIIIRKIPKRRGDKNLQRFKRKFLPTISTHIAKILLGIISI